MPLFTNPTKILEAAAADLLDPEMSSEVKDAVEALDDTLSSNVEEIKDEDKSTNGGIPVTTEMCNLIESATTYGRAKYLISFDEVMRICEDAEEAAEDAGAEPETAEAEVDGGDIVADIAEKNGVDPEQVAIVISAESARYVAECAINEAKAGKKKGKSGKKLSKMNKLLDQIKNKGFKVLKSDKKKAKK